MNFFKGIIFCIFGTLTLNVGAQNDAIIANFRTSEGDFSVALDFVNAPLTVANFIHLAGKGDDILETSNGVPLLSDPNHFRHLYSSQLGAETVRLPLNVFFVAATNEMREHYAIFQSQTFIGGVEVNAGGSGFHEDITGQDRIRLALVSGNPVRYRITLRYPRPWLDARDQSIQEAPMYVELPINRVETGRRFYAGSMTRSRFENPGYHFQDEVLQTPGNSENPFGSPFNQAWILAMDTLAPNQNGSRFFITSAADPSLNGRFTAFGQVLQNVGRQVVLNIANTATGDDQLPNRNMVIHDITIERQGLLAAAFFEGFQQTFLPGPITPMDLRIERIGGQFTLVSPLQPSSQISLYSSTDLQNFEGGTIEGQSPAALEASLLDLTPLMAFTPKLFVRGFAAEIPVWPSAEINFSNAQLSFKVTSGVDVGTLVLSFDSSGMVGGYAIDMEIVQTELGQDPVLVVSQGSGTFAASYDFSQGPYEGIISLSNTQGPLNVDEITLNIDSSRFANVPGVAEGAIIRRFSARTTDPEGEFLSYSGNYQKLR